jgi:glycosyltransferase involved in cell wall biosynthesis
MTPADKNRVSRQDPTLVSVVVPVHNASSTLADQLDGLRRQTYRGEWELILVDNNCDDDSIIKAASFRPDLPNLRFVTATRKASAAYARNCGAAAALGELLAFCDADDVVEPNWLSGLVETALHADLIGGRFDEASLNMDVTSGRQLGPVDRLPRSGGYLSFVVTSNCAVWMDVFVRLGGFSEHFLRAAGEDVDFSFRAQYEGYELAFASNAVVRYRHRNRPSEIRRRYYNIGLCEPLLFKLHRDRGMPRRSLGSAIRNWIWIFLHAPEALVIKRKRARWMLRTGYAEGRLIGSWRHRVIYL